MTSEQIDQLLIESERSLWWEAFWTPLLGWACSLGAMLFALFSVSLEVLFFSFALLFVSVLSSFFCSRQWQKFKDCHADLVWQQLRRTAFYNVNSVITTLVKDIASLYHADPSGEVLPLRQAIRLIDLHHKQQKRLEVVIARLGSLQYIAATLRDKTKQLRDLGESHEQGETRLQNLREDEAALDTMSEQIRASCHRIEMILIETRKAQQMRQLHQEISALTSDKSLSGMTLAVDSDDALSDIERQITREVETFLRLERETDRHLREI